MVFDKAIPELSLDDLNRYYNEGEECDKRVFAEMRTNLQLVAGEHYVREGSKYWNRIRDNKQLSSEQRVKLTKNHIQRVTKIYRNAIESAAPGLTIVAANESELQDQKSAELNLSYWKYIEECEDIHAKKATWIKNFVEIGEVCVKVFWDMDGGQVVGYEAQMQNHPDHPDDLSKMVPVLDNWGNPVQDSDKPVYGGKIRIETFEAFNLRRNGSSRTMSESPYLCLSKLIPRAALRSMIKDENDLRIFETAPMNEWTVYDNNTSTYRAVKDQVLVKEIYFRPGPAIPNGYFYIYTDKVKIAEGELPYGIFPIVHEGFDEQTGNPRSHSVIRHCRPPQIEINRCASKMAEHQVTLGDDKAWVPANTKVSQGSMLPGIRVNTFTGVPPTVTPGRTGDQYLPYLESQIDELYKLANLQEMVEDKPESPDLYTNLMRSYRFKKKFSIYGEKFERFLIRVAKTALQIAKKSANEDELVPALGKSEYINIPEFKNSQDINYQIRFEPRSDDVETQFGEQITLNHLIQYIGPQLGKEDIGQMIQLSPFLNKKQMFRKFTQKYDNLENLILSMDRGKPCPPRPFDDHKYIIAGLMARMDQADFDRLPGPIQQLYQQTLQTHEQAEAVQLQQIQRAQSGFVPSGGYMVACDFYEGDPLNPNKTKRVRIPSESINWLIQKLKDQGTEIDALGQMPQAALSDIGTIMQNQKAMIGQMVPSQSGVAPGMGGPAPQGMAGQPNPGALNAA